MRPIPVGGDDTSISGDELNVNVVECAIVSFLYSEVPSDYR